MRNAVNDSEQVVDIPRRKIAIDTDESADAATIGLATLWRDLVAGTRRIVDSFHSDARFYLILVDRDEAESGAEIESGDLEILERWLRACSQQYVAIDLERAASTIASRTKRCLFQMGLSCSSLRIPALLVMASLAKRTASTGKVGRIADFESAGASYSVLSVERPDTQLPTALTPAETAVVRLLVEGKSHVEIARARQSSRRTVANQLSSAFQRLRVSSRLDLVTCLAARHAGH
jgi:DNA-binding CsgD family transcriptional regulator